MRHCAAADLICRVSPYAASRRHMARRSQAPSALLPPAIIAATLALAPLILPAPV